MVTTQVALLDPEPTQDFNERSTGLLGRWEAGEITFESALESAEALLQEALREGRLANEARAHHVLGYLQNHRGSLSASIRHYERARLLFTQLGNTRRRAIIDLNQGENYRSKGNFQRARELYHAAYQTASSEGFLLLQTVAIANEGQTLLTLGQPEQALASLLEARELVTHLDAADPNVPGLRCEVHHVLALIYKALERYDEAWGEARAGVRMALDIRQPLQLGLANRAAGEVLMAMDKPPLGDFSTNPDEYFQAATDIFREINAEGEMARTVFSHSKSLARRGKRMTAARKLQQAMIIFTKLGMVEDAARAAETQLEILRSRV
ncbi:MAG: tetratricopeptide repeat protein [Chloroflexi bacterium]|nr:tetratricopeptide repeat protein [Chloroflexota bacterium]